MCSICNIKNKELLSEVEMLLDRDQGNLTEKQLELLKDEFPDCIDEIDAISLSDCSTHWNFHQAVYSIPESDVSIAHDVGKSEAGVLYDMLGKQVATFNAMTNRINEVLHALGDLSSSSWGAEDKSKILSIPVISPEMAKFYDSLSNSIRATTKELREMNAQVNCQETPETAGLKALAAALSVNKTKADDDMTTDKFDY